MNRRIPNGAYCVWRLKPTGTRQGKVVVAQHRDIQDPEHGGTYTVKIYESDKLADEHGEARNVRVVLRLDSNDPSFSPIVVQEADDGESSIVAELLEVLWSHLMPSRGSFRSLHRADELPRFGLPRPWTLRKQPHRRWPVNGPNQRVDKAAARLWAAAFVLELNHELARDIPQCAVGAAHPVLGARSRRTRASVEAE
jgi:hypothetical protein